MATNTRDRERLLRGLQTVRQRTDQLEPQRRLVDLIPFGVPAGDADGILWGWMMDAQALLGKLQTLMDDVIEERTDPEVAVLAARIAIRQTVNNLRPKVTSIPNFPRQPVGARAELGQAYTTCVRLVRELGQLLEDSDELGDATVTIRLMR
ncbi:MAG: hypothetical protein IVW57_18690 [Ktedonobacterales bacterium]|nr:hypothetical protein [Ktedonobacterales bacterium]